MDDPHADEESRFAVHQQSMEMDIESDPYADEQTRFTVHMQSASDDPYETEDSRFAVHQKTMSQEIMYDEDAKFLMHQKTLSKEQDEGIKSRQQSLAARSSVEDEFDEDARFAVHLLTHEAEAQARVSHPVTTASVVDHLGDGGGSSAIDIGDAMIPTATPSPPQVDGDALRNRDFPSDLQRALELDDVASLSAAIVANPSLPLWQNSLGRTPLWVACFHRSTWCVQRLLKRDGSDDAIQVDSADAQGTTPLHVSLWKHGDPRIIRALRAAGASTTSRPSKGGLKAMDAVTIAKHYKRPDNVIALLLNDVDSMASPSSTSPAKPKVREGSCGERPSNSTSEQEEEELRTRPAVPVWVGPGGELRERTITRSSERDDADADDEALGGKAVPSLRSQRARPQSNSTLSLQTQLLSRSHALQGRQGFSTTRAQSQEAEAAAAHQLERTSNHSAEGAAGEADGIEEASAALMDAVSLSAVAPARRPLACGVSDAVSSHRQTATASAPIPAVSPVAMMDEEVQREILGTLPLSAAGRASQVCRTWRDLLGQDDVWRRLCQRNGLQPALYAASSGGNCAATSWRAVAIEWHADRVALASRWRRNVCLEDVLHVHSDHLMSLQLHRGLLISTSADHTVRLTDISRLREQSPDGSVTGAGKASFVPRNSTVLTGHNDQVLHAHASDGWDGPDDHLASCSADGTVCIWSLGGERDGAPYASMLRRWPRLGAICVQLDAWRLTCAGEGTAPIMMYDWRDGSRMRAFEDDDPPLGVNTSLHRASTTLAAGNTFSRSQLRTWDVPTGALVDRFSLPPACRGVRCVQLIPEEHALVAGCANGWIIWCDLREGRYEKKASHAECVNSVHLRGGTLITAADDGHVRMIDTRSFAAYATQRLKRVVFAACADDEHVFAGCDDGTIHHYDYSARAAAIIATRESHGTGGFSEQQKQAFTAAVEAARRRQVANDS